MPQWESKSGEVEIKVAVIGQPGSGKGSILRYLANTHGQAAVRTGIISEAEVLRSEFIWAEPIPEGPFIRVRVFALSGSPCHQAAEQLLLTGCDAVVFVVDCDPQYVSSSRDNLLALTKNAKSAGLNWENTIVVMQYNRAERYPQLNPDELDQWLGIAGGQVARHVTYSQGTQANDNIGVAVNDAVQKVVSRLCKQFKEERLPTSSRR